jgi:hypothetical protein
LMACRFSAWLDVVGSTRKEKSRVAYHQLIFIYAARCLAKLTVQPWKSPILIISKYSRIHRSAFDRPIPETQNQCRLGISKL